MILPAAQAAVDEVGVVAGWHAAHTETAVRNALYAATRTPSRLCNKSDDNDSDGGCNDEQRDEQQQQQRPDGSAASWRVTRRTSPYRVLSATGVYDDYYTHALSWGSRRLALILRDCLLLFPHDDPRQRAVATCNTSASCAGDDVLSAGRQRSSNNDSSDSNAGAATAAAALQSRHSPTSVAMTRYSDEACFVGMDDGSVALYTLREDGRLSCSSSFCVPTRAPSSLRIAYAATTSLLHEQQQQQRQPPSALQSSSLPQQTTATASTMSAREAATMAVLRRACDTMTRLAYTTTSMGCMTTSSAHPWLVFAGTAARGVVVLDARQPHAQPCMHFSSSSSSSSDSSTVTEAAAAASGDDASTSRVAHTLLRRAAADLCARERICALTCNASGAFVASSASAATIGGGVVRVWSLSQPREPVHVLLPPPPSPSRTATLQSRGVARLPPPTTTTRALCFHPTDCHELAVGWSSDASLRLYGVAAAASPSLRAAAQSSAALTQVVYAPDGSRLVSSHGATPSPSSSLSSLTLRARSVNVYAGMHDDDDDDNSEDTSTLLSPTWPPLPSHALVVWCRRRQQRRLQHQHDPPACFRYSNSSRSYCHDNDDDSDNGRRGGGIYAHTRTLPWQALVAQHVLPGHRARPLHLAVPVAQSAYAGCVASLSCADADKTLRLWRVFDACDARAAWLQRACAARQSATSSADVDDAAPLR